MTTICDTHVFKTSHTCVYFCTHMCGKSTFICIIFSHLFAFCMTHMCGSWNTHVWHSDTLTKVSFLCFFSPYWWCRWCRVSTICVTTPQIVVCNLKAHFPPQTHLVPHFREINSAATFLLLREGDCLGRLRFRGESPFDSAPASAPVLQTYLSVK